MPLFFAGLTFYMNKQIQIDFLPVDSGEKSGDAIAFRYGDFSDRRLYQVVIIDGGTKDSGNRLVEHINEFFDTNHVDLVVCTHPDGDHASGLRQVLNQCSVGELWIHKPWEHSEHVRDLFHDGRITDNSLSERLQKGYTYAHQLCEIANEKGIAVREPFAGRKSDDGAITVLGPTIDYYRELIPEFARSPQAKDTLLEKAFSAFESVVNWIKEGLHIETLGEDGETSAENRSSAVLLLEFDGRKYLFTGDAGIDSFKKVIAFCDQEYIDISEVHFMQVPHHGSKRNISPSILNKIRSEIAYVSVSKDADPAKHPSKKVTNAYTRRGSKVYTTSGNIMTHLRNAPRTGWSSVASLPLYEEVEE